MDPATTQQPTESEEQPTGHRSIELPHSPAARVAAMEELKAMPGMPMLIGSSIPSIHVTDPLDSSCISDQGLTFCQGGQLP
jgi:hypothetical protein